METSGGSKPASLHPKYAMEEEFSFSSLVSDGGDGLGVGWLIGQFSECWGRV